MTVASKSQSVERQAAAQAIINEVPSAQCRWGRVDEPAAQLRKHSGTLVDQSILVSRELIRGAAWRACDDRGGLD